MKRFRFTLQPLSTLRQRKEHEAMERYAAALRGREAALAEQHAAEQALAAGQQAWKSLATAGCSAGELARHQAHCAALELRRRECAGGVERAERDVAAALRRMLQARQDREAVDQFRVRQFAAYDRERGREEQKFLDELAHRRTDVTLTGRPGLNALP